MGAWRIAWRSASSERSGSSSPNSPQKGWEYAPPAKPDCSRKSASWSSRPWRRSEEHTSELQSRLHLVCRLLLEKKKKKEHKTKPFRNENSRSESRYGDDSHLRTADQTLRPNGSMQRVHTSNVHQHACSGSQCTL